MSARSGRHLGVAAGGLALLAVAAPSPAQVVTDGSVGAARALDGPNYAIGAELGTLRQRNLFHSFQRFDIGAGASATFSGPESVENILGRVTGGTASSVEGLIRSTVPGANLYLINPAGMVLGPGARLDVQGSFFAASAEAITFTDGATYSAREPGASTLTLAPPSGFGFLDAPRAGVAVTDATLRVPDGERIVLAGASVIVKGADVTAAGGQVQLEGVAGPASVAVVGTGSGSRGGEVQVLAGSTVDVNGHGGAIMIRGGHVVVHDATLAARGIDTGPGRVDVEAMESITLARSLVDVRSGGGQTAGSVSLTAARIVLDAQKASGATGIVADGAVGSLDFQVALDITHTFVSDLNVVLVSPSGSTVRLFDGVGGSGSNFAGTVLDDRAPASIVSGSAPFTGTFRPEGAFATYVGETASGLWALQISDVFFGDQGALTHWSLAFGGETHVSGDVPTAIFDNTTVTSTLNVQAGAGVIATSGGSTGGHVSLTAQHLSVLGEPTLSATGGGTLAVAAETVTAQGLPARFESVNGVGRFTIPSGQVVLDGSVGPALELDGPVFDIPHTLGTVDTSGQNLFHSFSNFGLVAGESAVFTGPDDLQNIVARITGGGLSLIDGTVQSTVAGANLFLLNPSGLLFGPGGRLDLAGAFTGTTADALTFGGTGMFVASGGEPDLTGLGGQVTDFHFVGDTPAGIDVNGAFLSVPGASHFSLVGGDINVANSTILAFSGTQRFVSLAAPGLVHVDGTALTPVDAAKRGSLSLRNVGLVVDESFAGHGQIFVRGGQLTLDGFLTAFGFSSGVEAGIDIGLTGDLVIDGATTLTVAGQTGTTGGIRIAAADVQVNATTLVSTQNLGGQAGPITLDVHDLTLNAFTRIETQAGFGLGSGAGRLVVRAAGDIDMGASSRFETTGNEGIFVGGRALHMDNTDIHSLRQGDVQLALGSLSMSNGANIRSGGELSIVATESIDMRGTSGGGGFFGATPTRVELTAVPNPTGSISINTPSLVMDDLANIVAAGFDAGGTIDIEAGTVQLGGGAVIGYEGFSARAAGAIRVTAGESLVASGEGDAGFLTQASGIRTQTHSATVDGGPIIIETGLLRLDDGAEIATDSVTVAAAGDVTITANDVHITDGAHINTFSSSGAGGTVAISASRSIVIDGRGNSAGLTESSGVNATTSVGVGGSIRLTGPSIWLGNQAALAASASALGGRGGSIELTAGDVSIVSGAQLTTSARSGSRAGTIRVDTDTLNVAGFGPETGPSGLFSTTERLGADAGSVRVVAKSATLADGAQISIATDSPAGDGGDARIEADRLELVGPGTAIVASTSSGGRGGDVTIDGDWIRIADGALVAATTSGAGDGGGVRVNAHTLEIDGSDNPNFTGITTDALGTEVLQFSAAVTVANTDCLFCMRLDATVVSPQGTALSLFETRFSGFSAPGTAVIEINEAAEDEIKVVTSGRYTPATPLSSLLGESATGTWTLQLNDARFFPAFDTPGDLTSWSLNIGGTEYVSTDVPQVIGPLAISSLVINEPGLPLATTLLLPGGKAGDVQVSASGTVRVASGGQISTSSAGPQPGGLLSIAAGTLEVRDNALLRASTSGAGPGGDIVLRAEALRLDASGISATTNAAGDAGTVTVVTGRETDLDNGAFITVQSTGTGLAGGISVDAGQVLSLAGGSSISTAAASADGGNIKVAARDLVLLNDSAITATVQGGAGAGGNVDIDPVFVILNGSTITANALGGPGGNISITTDFFFMDTASVLSASSQQSIDGEVAVNAPESELGAELTELPGDYVDPATRLTQPCGQSAGATRATLSMEARGGLRGSPDAPVTGTFLATSGATPVSTAAPSWPSPRDAGIAWGDGGRQHASVSLHPAGAAPDCAG